MNERAPSPLPNRPDPPSPTGPSRARSALAGRLARLAVLALFHAALLSARASDAGDSPADASANRARTPTIQPAPRTLVFDVFLGETPIGFHRFAFRPSDQGFVVEVEARFAWTVLGVKALDYDHRNREQWRSGCLVAIDSKTRQNGKDYRVVGAQRGDRFEIESQDGAQRLEGCIGTFAYWDRAALLGRRRLLNAQTGEHLAARTRALGTERRRVEGRDVAVDRYRIEGDDLAIELAYARDAGDWLALESPVLLGKKLRYRRVLQSAVETDSAVDHP